jgi:hypothetical protein
MSGHQHGSRNGGGWTFKSQPEWAPFRNASPYCEKNLEVERAKGIEPS